jgi:hypothetical protein
MTRSGLGAKSGPSLVQVNLATGCGCEIDVDFRLKQGKEKPRDSAGLLPTQSSLEM